MERNGQFELDAAPTVKIEAGWVDAEGDKGGETIFGITRNYHPEWPGWAMVDQMRPHPSFPASANNDLVLRGMAREFFKVNFWDAVHGDELPWRMAAVVYDMAVNSDVRPAVRQAQIALNALGADLVVDGDMGARTVKACWDKGKDGAEEFLTQRLLFYFGIMEKDPTQKKWARGWLRRIIEMCDYALED